ncbi:hypothetical protein K0M31_002961, partial [Melipona bicolor]
MVQKLGAKTFEQNRNKPHFIGNLPDDLTPISVLENREDSSRSERYEFSSKSE